MSSYYTGFEGGTLPALWSGYQWQVVSSMPYEGYFSLYSEHTGDTITFTKTITTPGGGVIAFWYKATQYSQYCGYPYYTTYYPSTSTTFYIDNQIITTTPNPMAESSWTYHYFTVPAGTHTFKWKNNGWSTVCGGPYFGQAWIDFVICPN